MAYRDPYTEHSGPSQVQRRYSDSQDFNPYSVSQPHQTYYQGGIGPSYDGYGSEYRDSPQHNRGNSGGMVSSDSENVLESGAPFPQEKRTARALGNDRYGHQGGLWTMGGRRRCVGRFCCCTLMISALLFVCIVLTLILWARPPNVVVGDINTVKENGSKIQLVENGISVNLGVNISVDNPNYFSIDFRQVKAEIFYPINNTKIGEGVSRNVIFHAHTLTNWTFPFTINYTTTIDPDHQILIDLARKCGVGGTKGNLSVKYKITLGLRLLLVTISPVVQNTLSFECPIDPDDLRPLIKGAGINIPGLNS